MSLCAFFLFSFCHFAHPEFFFRSVDRSFYFSYSSFIPKFISQIYKCKPISTVGAEQVRRHAHGLLDITKRLKNYLNQYDFNRCCIGLMFPFLVVAGHPFSEDYSLRLAFISVERPKESSSEVRKVVYLSGDPALD